MGELTHDEETAAMEGLATNAFISPFDRLQLALQVIERLRAREHERVRIAVADTLRYVRVNWTSNQACDQVLRVVADLGSAEEATRGWVMEPGDWCCPFCEEVECDSDCPLARVREELG